MTESVLFEDTASISCMNCERYRNRYTLIGILIGFIVFCMTISSDGMIAGSAIIICTIIGAIISFSNKLKWDNVNIETRGGKIIQFSVEAGKGNAIMEQIEEEKREWEKRKK